MSCQGTALDRRGAYPCAAWSDPEQAQTGKTSARRASAIEADADDDEERATTERPSLTGGCLCGGIRFELTEPARDAGYCHCTRCQKRTGGAASAQARIDGRTFRLLQGDELVRAWRHADGGFEKCFCGECGAHLFSRNPGDLAQMSVRMSAFDGDPGVRPTWRAFVAYAADWEPIPDDGLERHDEAKPR